MHRTSRWAVIAGALAWAWLPAAVNAQTSDNWQFRAFVYGYLPDIGGSTSFPTGASSSVNVDANTLISNLKFTFMGTFEASKGRYGFITDILYLNVGGSQSNTRNVTVNGRELPIGVSSNVSLDIEGTVWTLGGEYHAIAQPAVAVDVIAGARLLDLKQTLGYSFTADVGPIAGPGRSGNSEVKTSYWDAIVGARGRFAFGSNREWFVPVYADVGTGQSKLTWQVLGGVGYAFSWGQVIGGWRYLDYRFKSGSNVQDLNFNGPMVGVAFQW